MRGHQESPVRGAQPKRRAHGKQLQQQSESRKLPRQKLPDNEVHESRVATTRCRRARINSETAFDNSQAPSTTEVPTEVCPRLRSPGRKEPRLRTPTRVSKVSKEAQRADETEVLSQHRLRSPVKKRPRLRSPVHKSRVEVSKEAPGFVKSKVFQEEKAPVVEKWKKGNQERWIEGDWFCQRCGNHNFHWKGFHYNLNGDLSMQLATL